ncbi:hypothetical protein N7466_009657 [Penicillium verhagenii]|uniref:uncharacterized protein n=1 Tax=Penicillium verhagenii TaxID=1562060 RepID=UPI002544FC58|nr:uncharacterized protein N7466_009657 [Penicillium verhagenii]KAJ5921331.1 hypothetical protein N7466_009657 [Penicillium verhagenii]
MQYKALVSILTLTSSMTTVVSAGVLQKRSPPGCAPYGRQFCCAIEEVPDKEILPGLYLFVYGVGCLVERNRPDLMVLFSVTLTTPDQITA